MADTNPTQLRALLNICDIARKTSDTGTIDNIANQIRDVKRPRNILLSRKFDDCIGAAFGKIKKEIDVRELLRQISDRAKQLESDCGDLLNAAPQVAIDNKICKSILLE